MKKRIEMTLTAGNQARFEYTDGEQAQTHYEELRARMAIGGLAIKTITISDIEERGDERDLGGAKANHRKNTVLGDRSH